MYFQRQWHPCGATQWTNTEAVLIQLMKTQVVASRWWDYPYQAWAGAKKLLPFMTTLIKILKRSSFSILLIFAEKLLNCSLQIMVSVQLQTGEVFVKIRQHFNYKNKLSFVLQNLNGEMKEAVSIFFFLIIWTICHFSLTPQAWPAFNGSKRCYWSASNFVACRIRLWDFGLIQRKPKTVSLPPGFREH